MYTQLYKDHNSSTSYKADYIQVLDSSFVTQQPC